MNKKGFTLVELLAAVAIIALLLILIVPNVVSLFNRSIEETMKIEEGQAVDAASVYIRDNCGRTAVKDKQECNIRVTDEKLENNEVYFCLKEVQGQKYIGDILLKGKTPCDGVIIYKYDSDDGKFSEGKAYLTCGENLYTTEGADNYKEQFTACNVTVPETPSEPEPEPEPNPPVPPTPAESIFKVSIDNVGGTSEGYSQIYLKYGIGWYSDNAASNQITSLNTPVKTGYTFNGYYTGVNGTLEKVVDETGNIISGKERVFTSDGTLYANWISEIYRIALNDNGATTSGTKEIYEKYNVAWYSEREAKTEIRVIEKPSKPGYIFTGYNTESGIKVIEETGNILDGKTNTFTSEGVLNALYESRIYPVSLSQMNATTHGTETIFLKYGIGWYEDSGASKEINSIKAPKREGYLFDGYYTGQNGQGNKVIDKDGKIIPGTTTAISQEAPAGVLFPNWVEDTSCKLAEAYYVGRVYPTVKNGVFSKLRVINVLKNIDEEIDNNGKDYGQFSVIYDWRVPDGYNKWRVYAKEDGLYYTTKEKPTNDDLKPFTFLTWEPDKDVNYYIYKKDCIKKPTGMTYVGSVFNTRPESFLQEAYVINYLTNVSEIASIHGSSKDYQNFVLNYDYVIGALDQWRLYAKEDDLFYSNEEASTFEELKPLSILTWDYSKQYKVYIYKKHKVDTPNDAIYLGQAFTVSSNFNEKNLYAFDKINNKSELISTSGLYDYSSFVITFDGRPIDTSDWRIYAKSDDIYYSEKETTNSNDLKLLSSLQWKYGETKKLYFYQKKLINKPNNYTYVGSVFTAGLPSNHQIYGVDKIGNKNSLCGRDAVCDFKLFAVKYDGAPVDDTDWKLYAKDDDIYYSEKHTTDEKDLKLLSSIYWKKDEFKRYYLYKKNKVETPNNYTYVGSAFTAGISTSSVEMYAVDKVGNKNGLDENSGLHDHTSFAIKYDGRPVDDTQWSVYATDDDIYYSTKETTNESDLKPLSFLDWKKSEIKRYYFYKKKNLKVPSSMTYVGSVFTVGINSSPAQVYIVDKVNNDKKVLNKEGTQTCSNFAVAYHPAPVDSIDWRIYATSDDIYYSEKETSSLSDLKPLSYLQWKRKETKRYYFYKKGNVNTPSNYTYVGSVFTAGTTSSGKQLFVVNKLANIKETLNSGKSKNYTNFEINSKPINSLWQLASIDSDLYYSESETTDASSLKSLSKLELKYKSGYRYYIYKKK